MKILVITRNAWSDTNSIGNTLSNFFAGIEDVEFANIYFRSANPSNKLCQKYYRITETEVLKKWVSPKKIGKRFSYIFVDVPNTVTSVQKRESAAVRFIRRRNVRFAYWLSDRIWYSKKWQNEKLSSFIEDFNPDLVFTFVKSAPQYYLTVKFLREKFNIPVFSWIADDEYTGLANRKAEKEIHNLKYILRESAVVTGCSQEICDYYHSVFGVESSPLYKGCDLLVPLKDYVNKPLRMIYAGNLLYGRMAIIQNVANILARYDPHGKDIVFEIYSNTPITSEEEKYFSEISSVKYMGCVDYDIIKQRLSESDVVLHAESFDEEQILKTRYSFSTKIIDCLQSGCVMLAIGPKELASIAYIKQIPGVCTIDSQEQLEDRLIAFLDDRCNFVERSRAIRAFAQEHHNRSINIKNIELKLKKTMEGKV